MTRSAYVWSALPLADWPLQDGQAWAQAKASGDPLDPGGAASGLAQATQGTMQWIYGALLAWLKEQGELDPAAGPAERLTPDRYLHYLAARRQSVSANTLFNNLRMLAMMMNCLAPGQEWGWLYRHPQAPRRQQATASRQPVRLVVPGVLMVRLLNLLREFQDTPVSRPAAVRLRDLLLVGVCTATALRARNLLQLTIGTTILRHASGYEIRFGPEQIKNGRQVAIWLMDELTPFLDLYVQSFRPELLRPQETAGGALWVSLEGNRLANPSLSSVFARITPEVAGRRINPHALRHAAATSILTADPRRLDSAAAVLGHKDTSTTSQFYDLSGGEAARAKWRSLTGRFRPVPGTAETDS